MTLPRGFGMGNTSRCTECGEYKNYKNKCKTPDCIKNKTLFSKIIEILKS